MGYMAYTMGLLLVAPGHPVLSQLCHGPQEELQSKTCAERSLNLTDSAGEWVGPLA